jgi:chemotaxis-related protein WspB
MLYLIIHLGGDRYAVESAQVAEVLPLLRLKTLPGAPAGVAGLINYHGDAVPVVDLNVLAFGVPTPTRVTARIVMVHYAPDGAAASDGATTRLLGLLVPRAAEMARHAPADFTEAGVRTDGAPYLGPVLTDAHGVLQRVAIPALLSAELRGALFPLERSA